MLPQENHAEVAKMSFPKCPTGLHYWNDSSSQVSWTVMENICYECSISGRNTASGRLLSDFARPHPTTSHFFMRQAPSYMGNYDESRVLVTGQTSHTSRLHCDFLEFLPERNWKEASCSFISWTRKNVIIVAAFGICNIFRRRFLVLWSSRHASSIPLWLDSTGFWRLHATTTL